MRAVVYTEYGPPEVLGLTEIETPAPKRDEVLVKLRATSVNASDWEFLTGTPLYARVMGVRKPKVHVLGSDIAGQVEAVGENVTGFQPGDEVFGDIFGTWGGFAEYVCAPEKHLMLKPPGMSFAQAAAVPQAAAIARQGLYDKGMLQSGQAVLINGAGGGAGTFAVQMANILGAEVTAVDNTEKLDIMRSLGANRVIDYTNEDFTRVDKRFDLIFDLAAHRSIFDYSRSLNPGGRYVMVGGAMAPLIQLGLLGPWISLLSRKRLGLLMLKQNEGLPSVVAQIAAGEIAPVIDRCFPLAETAEALRYLGEGHCRGKVVVTITPEDCTNSQRGTVPHSFMS